MLVEDTVAFGDKVKKLHPQTPLLVTLPEGEHGFDTPGHAEDGVDQGMKADWCQEGLSFITKQWLGA